MKVSFIVWIVFKVPYTTLYVLLMARSYKMACTFVKMLQAEQRYHVRHWLIIGSLIATGIWFVLYTICEIIITSSQAAFIFYKEWYLSSYFCEESYRRGLSTVGYYLSDIKPFVLITLVIL